MIVANSGALGSGALTIHNGGTVQLQAGLSSAVLLPAVQFDGTTDAWQERWILRADKFIVENSATHATAVATLRDQILRKNKHHRHPKHHSSVAFCDCRD